MTEKKLALPAGQISLKLLLICERWVRTACQAEPPDVHPARARGSVLAAYSSLPLEVHASSPSSPLLPPHRPDGERFQFLCIFPYPRNAQLKRKKHSISIVGRARQRVHCSLLIGSASARHDSAFAKVPALGPKHSRSRPATRRGLAFRAPYRDLVADYWMEALFSPAIVFRSGPFAGASGAGFTPRVPCHPGRSPRAYFAGREPVIRMSTSLLALCCQSGLVATLATPTRARSRSSGSRSLRMSPLRMARFTKARRASWTCA